MDINTIWRDIFPRKESVSSKYGIVIGNMGSGKTTLCKYLTYKYSLLRPVMFFKFNLIDDFLEFLDKPYLTVKNYDYFFLLDDVSFSLFGISREARLFLNKFFKIRHRLNAPRIFTFFVVHYSKSIARFLRGAHLKVLTSIDTVELNSLNELFDMSTLIDYYEYYVENYDTSFIYLIKTPKRVEIVDFTLNDSMKSLLDDIFKDDFVILNPWTNQKVRIPNM